MCVCSVGLLQFIKVDRERERGDKKQEELISAKTDSSTAKDKLLPHAMKEIN